VQQVRRDEVSRDHKEDIDPDEPSGQLVGPQMKSQDQGHRNRPKSLDVRSKSPRFCTLHRRTVRDSGCNGISLQKLWIDGMG
jgi:hypothetical protein